MSIKSLREVLGINQIEFAERYGIPLQTVRQWESKKGATSHRECPEYVVGLIGRLVGHDIMDAMNRDLGTEVNKGESACVIMHKDIPTCLYVKGVRVRSAVINKLAVKHLPLPIKRAIHYKDEYISSENTENYILNANGARLIDLWLEKRGVSMGGYVCKTTDCYWIRERSELITWNMVKPYTSEKKKIVIKTDDKNEVLCVREIVAGIVYDSIEYDNYCRFDYVKDEAGNVTAIECEAFTDEDTELVTAADLIEESGLSRRTDAYSQIVSKIKAYGLDPDAVRKHMDIQTMVDYLVTNRNRTPDNIGFLRDPDTLEFIGVAPAFDNGSNETMEAVEPEGIVGTTVMGLYDTEDALLKSITDIKRIDLAQLPNKLRIFAEYAKCKSISDQRISQLARLYSDKREYLWDKWMEQK